MSIRASIMAAVISANLVTGVAAQTSEGDASPLQLFEQRIMPIFKSPDPSSCVQCHLSSVDLKEYILPSHEATFTALRDQGLIDLENPPASKILELIRMGDRDLDEGARLIHQQTREAEYHAFAAWIKASASDPRLRQLPASAAAHVGPDKPEAIVRHARKSRVVDSFERNVWSQRMRCFPCHTPHELDPSNPRHQVPIKKQQEMEAKLGPEVAERLKIFRESPQATLQYLIDASRSTSGDRLPLINLDEPTMSLIVKKPTSKLPPKREDGSFQPPSSTDPVSHLGGLKMHRNDPSYKAFIAWIQDYARVVGDHYQSVDQLPADNWFPTKRVIRVTDVPDEWRVGDLVQLLIYAWDESEQAWEAEPLAFTQGAVTPRRIVNGALFLLNRDATPTRSMDVAQQLAEGKYLVKTYVDVNGRLTSNPVAMLGDEEYAGQIVMPRARWREGFRRAEKVSGKKIER